MLKQTIVTTSWDDGHKLDLRLAKLLKKYHIKGTFNISPKNRKFKKQDLLSDKEIVELSKYFEIGAHTMTHPRLTRINEKEAFKEIIESKRYLENLTKKKIKCFCYPFGDYNKKIKEFVRKADYVYARTTKQISFKFPKDPFECSTTIQAFPLSFRVICGEIKYAIKSDFRVIPRLFSKSWEIIAKRLFDYTLKNGGVYHLWGHSWVIDKYGGWDRLESVLDYIGNKSRAKYLTNSQVIGGLKR